MPHLAVLGGLWRSVPEVLEKWLTGRYARSLFSEPLKYGFDPAIYDVRKTMRL